MTCVRCALWLLAAGLAFSTAAADDQVKWHPGHYVLVGNRPVQENHLCKGFRGAQRFYNWRMLEPERDRYDFSSIRTDLQFLARTDRFLVIQVQTKAFAPGQNCCPPYLAGAEYGGGVYKTRPGAFNPVIWDERVNQRLLALYRELGRQLDREPNLEAVVIPETAVTGDVRGTDVPYTLERYARSVTDGMKAAREAFPHTVVIQYVNLPTEIHQELADCALAHGIGIGGPDIFIHDPLLNDPQRGAYRLYPKLAGQVPLGTAVQPEDYTVKVFRGPVDPPTAKELYEFGRDTLHLNYMFWFYRGGYFEKVQAMIAEPTFPQDPAGGLATTRPSKLTVGPATRPER